MYERRKIVTALFCDLVGSTELSGVLEAETLRAVVMEYFDTMRTQIDAHGGTVEKFIGDAVMAVFGVPVVHEDDAHRAAAAALAMLVALEELNTELEGGVGCRLAVRIGLNSGEVVAGADDGIAENLVSGEVVNVAARLEAQAGPGQIFLGPTTRALLGDAAEVEEVGLLTLKGKSEPVAAFRLLGLTAVVPARSSLPLIGRDSELERLSLLWANAREGSGSRSVALSGDAGIGKSRLLQDWLAALPDRAATIGTAFCHPYRDEASLTPLATAVRQVLDDADAAGLLTPEVRAGPAYRLLAAGLLRDGTPSPSADATYAAVAAVLAEVAAVRPVLLVLDDVHWARPMLLEGVDKLAEALAADPVLLVRAGRQGSPDPGTVHIRLSPLSDGDSARLVATLVELEPHGAEASSAAVVERAEGNPLYLEQLLAMVHAGASPHDLPATVTAVLAARIDVLGQDERTLLDACAVIGRRFDPAGARDLVEGPVEVHALVRTGLVEPVPDDRTRYRFSSGLIREVAYNGISKRRRATWHEHLAGLPGIGAAASGGHYEQAYLHRSGLGLRGAHGEVLRTKAARTLTEAARGALARADVSWSEELYQRAFTHSTRDDPWWTETARGLGETWLALGRQDEGRALLLEVLTVADAAGDDLARAHTKLQLTSLDPGCGLGSPADAAREALPVFEFAADRLGLSRAHVRIAQEQQVLGRHRLAGHLLAAALDHAVAADAVPERAMALGAWGISLWHGPTPAAEAVRRCRELLADHGPDHVAAMVTLGYPLANLLALQGDTAAAMDTLDTTNEFAAGLGYAEAALFAPLFSGGVEALAGRFAAAERLLVEAVDQARTLGHPGLLASAVRDLVRVQLELDGKTPCALPPSEDELPPADAADDFGVRALLEAGAGRFEPALDFARRAVDAASAGDSPVTKATAELDSARAYLLAGQAEAACGAALRAAELFRAKGHVVGERAATAAAAEARERGRP
jgi:class 3 adenylate cyclase/tetratricopeptide (TPR) repeat protein